MTYFQQPTQPLISDLQMELVSGERIHLGHTFILPPGLPGIGANDSGDRAPDSRIVVRSGDEITTTYSVTVPGQLHATNATMLLEMLEEFRRHLQDCRRLWRGDRAYLKVAYGVLPQPEMGYGWLSCKATPVFRLAEVAWYKPVWSAAAPPVQIGEEEVFG